MWSLDLGKVLMYEFHYHYIKNRYGNKLKLLWTDTDISMYEIKIGDVYEDFSKNKEMFGFRNYSTGSKYYGNSNKSVVGNNDYRNFLLNKKCLSHSINKIQYHRILTYESNKI